MQNIKDLISSYSFGMAKNEICIICYDENMNPIFSINARFENKKFLIFYFLNFYEIFDKKDNINKELFYIFKNEITEIYYLLKNYIISSFGEECIKKFQEENKEIDYNLICLNGIFDKNLRIYMFYEYKNFNLKLYLLKNINKENDKDNLYGCLINEEFKCLDIFLHTLKFLENVIIF